MVLLGFSSKIHFSFLTVDFAHRTVHWSADFSECSYCYLKVWFCCPAASGCSFNRSTGQTVAQSELDESKLSIDRSIDTVDKQVVHISAPMAFVPCMWRLQVLTLNWSLEVVLVHDVVIRWDRCSWAEKSPSPRLEELLLLMTHTHTPIAA